MLMALFISCSFKLEVLTRVSTLVYLVNMSATLPSSSM